MTTETINQITDFTRTENSSPSIQQSYPVEQPFKLPMVATALLVLVPALLVYWFFGDSSAMPRSLKLFFGNWISPIILWFFAASFFHLLLKRGRLRQEQQQTNNLKKIFSGMVTDGLTSNSHAEINQQIQRSAEKNGIKSNNLLLTRLFLFLNHEENDVDETFGIKERELMRGSYSLSRFMVWAIPIMGFIGTVWGISNGIAHFSDAMTSTSSVTDVSAMLKENLPLVTNSLATAFDTTLLALLLSIPLMMVMIWLEKQEEAYLIDLEEDWFHIIKPKIAKPSLTTTGATSAAQATGNTDSGGQAVASEIKLLSTQIKALQETMEDLYETVFASKLGKK